ncbi:MAG: 4-hydroxy-3-methylbut-2-enyl diphosphate reductase [FCB group bacterium]|nr:4-hydroxy-3-methylbut-2-enyl diphosphate reductase [FCB group bacterium]
MKIFVVKDAGYCFGVRDAVNKAYEATREYGEVYMLGDIVHNEKVVADLASAGARVVENLGAIPKGSAVLLRAHGTVKEVWKNARKQGMNIIDATCPLVHEIHREVKRLAEDGRQIIVIGDHNHDEVIAIADQVPGTIVLATPAEAEAVKKLKKAGVVSQSTQTIENVQEIIAVLTTKIFDLHFVNTICYPTARNQTQLKELAARTDIMIIIGSFTSANSKRLTTLAKRVNSRSYQVADPDEVDPAWFEGVETVGISAGASTPDYLIEDVKHKIERIAVEK